MSGKRDSHTAKLAASEEFPDFVVVQEMIVCEIVAAVVVRRVPASTQAREEAPAPFPTTGGVLSAAASLFVPVRGVKFKASANGDVVLKEPSRNLHRGWQVAPGEFASAPRPHRLARLYRLQRRAARRQHAGYPPR